MDGCLRVASTQVAVIDGDQEANKKAARSMALRIAESERDVDIILFHEVFLESGCEMGDVTPESSKDVFDFWQELSRECGIALMPGRLSRTEDGKLHNLATVFTPQGDILAEYSKVHLYGSERSNIEPGDHLAIFEMNGMRVGIMICADFGFPELSRAYALKGVDALLVTSSWAYPDDDLWDICNRARSSENGIYVVSCDRVGPTRRGQVKVGRSMMCDPNGFITANLAETVDTYFVGQVYKDQVDARHADMKWLEWVRPDLYPLL